MTLTLRNTVAVAPAPFPLEGCAAAKWGPHSRVVASPGIAVVTIGSDGSLAWRTLLAPGQHPLHLQAVAVHGDRVRLYSGHPTGQTTVCLPDVQEFDILTGSLAGTTTMPQGRKGMAALAHPDGRTLLVDGQDSGGKVHASGFLHLPAGAEESLFDDIFLPIPLREDVGVPTASAGVGIQIVKIRQNGKPRFLVLGNGNEDGHPGEIVRRPGGLIRMVIAEDVTVPYASRSGRACSFGAGFVYAGGTDGNNQPTSQIVAWDGTPGTQPEVVGNLPHPITSPTVFASEKNVYICGGYPTAPSGPVIPWGTVATAEAMRLEF